MGTLVGYLLGVVSAVGAVGCSLVVDASSYGSANGPGGATTLFAGTPGDRFSAIAADAEDNVYWTNGRTVWSCGSSSGCGTTVADGQTLEGTGFITYLVTGGGYLYWTGNMTDVRQCPIGGCGNSPNVIASDPDGPIGVAVDASNVYWTTSGAVKSCPIASCHEPFVVLTDSSAAGPIVLDDQNVYWLDSGGSIDTCPKTGCVLAPLVLAGSGFPASPESIAIDGNGVYFENGYSYDIGTCPRDEFDSTGACGANFNSPSLTDAGGYGGLELQSITSDGTSVYGTSSDGVFVCGSGTTCDVLNQIVPGQLIAVGSASVYVTTADPSVLRLSK
jgi:hypothetical protein